MNVEACAGWSRNDDDDDDGRALCSRCCYLMVQPGILFGGVLCRLDGGTVTRGGGIEDEGNAVGTRLRFVRTRESTKQRKSGDGQT